MGIISESSGDKTVMQRGCWGRQLWTDILPTAPAGRCYPPIAADLIQRPGAREVAKAKMIEAAMSGVAEGAFIDDHRRPLGVPDGAADINQRPGARVVSFAPTESPSGTDE